LYSPRSKAPSLDDSEITIEDLDASARTAPVGNTKTTYSSDVSPIVAHLIEQLVNYDYFSVLYLCKIDLSSSNGSANIDAIVEGLRRTKTLEAITLERCMLDDEGIEKLASGLEARRHIQKEEKEEGQDSILSTKKKKKKKPKRKGVLKTLRLRGNKIGNRGVQALEFVFRSSSTLEEVDLSDNCIGSKGAASVLKSLAQNTKGIPLSVLNLSQNEIWNLFDGDEDCSNQKRSASSSTTLSFLHTNSTLRELNLDGNCLHDEGVEYIAESLKFNQHRCVLKKLHLGWNGIGDNGTMALAKALEGNRTIKMLGLGENDITNKGARALLSALAVNTSIKEINGLYHNRIDRKFIIVAIKRLLHRKFEEENSSEEYKNNESNELSESNQISEASLIIGQVVTAEETESSNSSNSSSSSYCSEDIMLPMKKDSSNKSSGNNMMSSSCISNSSHSKDGSVALEAIDSWDWGTFGIEEIEKRDTEEKEMKIDAMLNDIEDELSKDEEDLIGDLDDSDDELETSLRSQYVPKKTDRLVIFQASPLAYFDRKTMQHHGIPMHDFAHESMVIKEIFSPDENGFADDSIDNGTIEVVLETATQKNLQNFFLKALSPVMHFSCYGNSDCLALENGFGYMQALTLDAMKKMIASAAPEFSNLEVMVVTSCHAQYLAEAFLNAGVRRVICLQREASSFRDEGTIDFARGFYGALQQSKNLRESFDAGINECTKSLSPPRLLDTYKLLPEGADHDVEIFFQNPPPPMMKPTLPTDVVRAEDPMAILPNIPDQFFGREVDIYEILESLRVDDVVRIGGVQGCGKKSILSVLSRYILERSKSFEIDSVFWLPPHKGVIPGPDSLYGDLCLAFQYIIAAEDDIWDDENYQEARDRILIQMEGRNSILVIDGRVFTNEIAGEMLERFLTHLLNEVNVKIILITASDTSRAKTKRSMAEETTIYLGPLDFAATVKLYGNTCPLIASTGFSNIDTVDEFESYLLPKSYVSIVDEDIADSPVADSKTPQRSHRQKELYDYMGGGNPKEIIQRAASCTDQELSGLLKIAQRPDVSVTTSIELEEQCERWTTERDHAISNKYYLRAGDIEKALEELEDLKKVYPTLNDMKAKEEKLKKMFSALLKAKRYNDANAIKRKILVLKRTMVKEKFSSSPVQAKNKAVALESINEIQERMKSMMALAESMNASFGSFLSEEAPQTPRNTKFSVSEGCTLEISCDGLASFWKKLSPANKNSMIVWTNESCDISSNDEAIQQMLSDAIGDKTSLLETLTTTGWGPVRCATGDSVVVNADNGFVALAVPPLPPAVPPRNIDSNKEESLQYMETRLRSAIRSSLRKIRIKNSACAEEKGAEFLGISTTTSLYNNPYRRGADETEEKYRKRNLAVTLNTIVEELRASDMHGSTNTTTTLRLFASSGLAIECAEMIEMASKMGLSKVVEPSL